MPKPSQPATTPRHAAAAPLPRARACSASITPTFRSDSGGQRPAGNASGRTMCRARSTSVAASAQASRSASVSPVALAATARSAAARAPTAWTGREVEGVLVGGIDAVEHGHDRVARLAGPPAPQRQLAVDDDERPGPHRPERVLLGAFGLRDGVGDSSKRPRRTSSSARPASAAAAWIPPTAASTAMASAASASSQRPSRSSRSAWSLASRAASPPMPCSIAVPTPSPASSAASSMRPAQSSVSPRLTWARTISSTSLRSWAMRRAACPCSIPASSAPAKLVAAHMWPGCSPPRGARRRRARSPAPARRPRARRPRGRGA